jgi:delta 1-pyrroline-5-carboxylate dehydrogenase
LISKIKWSDKMLAHTYLHDALLKVFVVIDLNLSKPLRTTLAELIVCLLEIEKVFIEAGFPEGVYQTLLISGSSASSLISRDEINAVSFTGSHLAGQKVAETAGKRCKEVHCHAEYS